MPQRQAAPTDRWLAYGTVPLRFFLGATFVYAGLQKISDPGFLQPGASTYIGTQLQGFVAHSPIGFLIQLFALPVPQLTGLGVIAAELVIGGLVIFGLATRWAAAGGAVLSFVLFLTASYTGRQRSEKRIQYIIVPPGESGLCRQDALREPGAAVFCVP